MTLRQQWTIVASVVAVLGIGLAIGSHYMRADLFPVEAGSDAPDFRAKVLGSNRYRTLADYKGQVVVLNIWATWCGPCIKEIPSLEKLYQEYGPKGLKLVAVSIDSKPGTPYVSEDSIRRFVDHFGVTFDVLHDSTEVVETAYQATGYPETFIIGREGTIRRKWIGADDWTSQGNRALIAQLLGIETPKAIASSGDR
ncbi:MAG TPA: TlpA disulfide reductase family protein [Gemmatimonadaceae bacterium]|jgi:thiol-disulfide isomerase/thioredoxin|nr:TlpA disulfide reductase family protein [Gemmatimonadaceae bacterium]